MNNSIIDIIERFQRRYALQEEREMKNFDVSTSGAGAPGVPDKNGMPKNSIFEKDVPASTVAVPASTEWSPPHPGLIAGGLHLSG
jgi:hypothetical protein